MSKYKVIVDVIQNVGYMLINNAELGKSGIAEDFLGWCEDGDIFYNGYEDYTEQERKFACEIMLKVAKNTNALSQQFYEIFEELGEEYEKK